MKQLKNFWYYILGSIVVAFYLGVYIWLNPEISFTLTNNNDWNWCGFLSTLMLVPVFNWVGNKIRKWVGQ